MRSEKKLEKKWHKNTFKKTLFDRMSENMKKKNGRKNSDGKRIRWLRRNGWTKAKIAEETNNNPSKMCSKIPWLLMLSFGLRFCLYFFSCYVLCCSLFSITHGDDDGHIASQITWSEKHCILYSDFSLEKWQTNCSKCKNRNQNSKKKEFFICIFPNY